MEAAQERRKRLKALSQEAGAQGDLDGSEKAGAGPLVNPFADDGAAADTTSGPFNFYSDPLGSMERSRLAQQRRAEQQQAQRAAQPQQPAATGVTPSQPQLGPAGAPASGAQALPPPFQQQPQQQPQYPGRPPWASGGPLRPHLQWQQQQWQQPPQQQWGQPYAQQAYPPPLQPPGPGGYQGLSAPPYQQQAWRPPPPGIPPLMRSPGGPGGMQGRGGRGGQPQQQFQHQQPGGRGRGRGYPSGGSDSSAGRGRGGAGSRGGEAYFSPAMLENPWADLERRLGVASTVPLAAKQQQQEQDEGQQHDGSLSGEAGAEAAVLVKPGGLAAEEGRLAAEGLIDRPWH